MKREIKFMGGAIVPRESGETFESDGKKIEWGQALVLVIGRKSIALTKDAFEAIVSCSEDPEIIKFLEGCN